MAAFFIYIIKWSISLTLLYSLYGLFLRKETFHSFNRIVLLSILVLSMIMPFCEFTTPGETLVSSGFSQIETAITGPDASRMASDASVATYPEIVVTPTGEAETAKWNVTRVIFLVYVLGVVFFWLRYVWHLCSLTRILVSSKECDDFRMPKFVTLLINNKVQIPFNWFGWIVMNENDIHDGHSSIIIHELTHVRRYHSLDVLLCDFTSNMLWFLPLSWMLRHDMRDVHEYEADQAVMHSGTNPTEYQMLLINKATGTGLQPLANGFNQCSIKKRLVMMYRKQSSKMARLKVLYILPLACIALAAFARPAIINDVSATLKAEEEKASLLLPSQIVTNEVAPVSVISTEQTAETSVTDEADELVSDDDPVLKVHVKDRYGAISVANVLIMDKDNRIVSHGITDLNGNAELRIPKGGETLQVSYVGYNTFNRKISHLRQVGASASIDVELVPTSINTPPIVVKGYPIPADTVAVDVSESVSSPEADSMDDTAFYIVEQMPEWKGGTRAMVKHIASETKYPELALMYREEARVTVDFIIDKHGLLLNPQIIGVENLNPIPESIYDKAKEGDIYAQERITAHEDVLDQFKAEAKRVVRTLAGKWTPGMQNGKPVNCMVRIPISFILETTVSQ